MSAYHLVSRLAGPDRSLADWAAESGIEPTAPTTERAAVSVTIDPADPRRAGLWHLSDYAVGTSSGSVVWLVPTRAASWLPPEFEPSNLQTDEVGEFWVVTVPTPDSELLDILFKSTVADIALSYRGGLKASELLGVFTDEGRAREFALKQLQSPTGPTAARRTAFFHRDDTLLAGLSFGELIDAVHSNEPVIDEAAVRKVFGEIVQSQMQDAEHELAESMGQIVADARQ